MKLDLLLSKSIDRPTPRGPSAFVFLAFLAPGVAVWGTNWDALNPGGGASQSAAYRIESSLGQIAGPPSVAGPYRLASGFVAIRAGAAAPPPVDPSAPFVSTIPDQAIDEDGRTDILPFTFGDPDSRTERLSLRWTSSNTELIPVRELQVGGAGANRTVRATPLPNRHGSTILTLTLSDGTHSNAMSFLVTVRPVNDAPTLSRIVNAAVSNGRGLDHRHGHRRAWVGGTDPVSAHRDHARQRRDERLFPVHASHRLQPGRRGQRLVRQGRRFRVDRRHRPLAIAVGEWRDGTYGRIQTIPAGPTPSSRRAPAMQPHPIACS